MKKLLYTTSALVGAAFLMEAVVPAKAEVNVSMRYRAALISKGKLDGGPTLEDQGVKQRSTSLSSSKIDFDFSGSKDHPNGLTTSAVLTADTAGGGNLSYGNAFGSISGSFGKIDIGDTHDVGYRALGYGVPGTSNFGAVDAGFNPSSPDGGLVASVIPHTTDKQFSGATYVNTSATGNIGGRYSTITYWSPSFSGAQVGVSWQPQSERGKDTDNSTSSGDVEDGLGLAATYSGSFGGTGVSMGVSYETAKVRGKASAYKGSDIQLKSTGPNPGDNAADLAASKLVLIDGTGTLVPEQLGSGSGKVVAATTLGVSRKNQNPTAFAGYVSFDVQGFTFGGSYGSWENAASNSAKTSEATAYALGAGYSVDNITFGVSWAKQTTEETFHNIRHATIASVNSPNASEVNASTATTRELDTTVIAFTTSYQLGDGAAIDFVIEQGDYEYAGRPYKSTTAPTDGDVVYGTATAKSTGFGVGIDLKF